METFAYIGMVTIGLIVALLAFWFWCWFWEFYAKVKSYPEAKELKARLDSACKAAEDSMNERDEARVERNAALDELAALKARGPYRGLGQ